MACQSRCSIYICIVCMEYGHPTGEWLCSRVERHDPYSKMICTASKPCQNGGHLDSIRQDSETFLSKFEPFRNVKIRRCPDHGTLAFDKELLFGTPPGAETLFRWAYFRPGAGTHVAFVLEDGVRRAGRNGRFKVVTEDRCLISERKEYWCETCKKTWLEVKAGDLDAVTGTRFLGGHTCSYHVKMGAYCGHSAPGSDEDTFYLRLQCKNLGFLPPVVESRQCHVHSNSMLALNDCFYDQTLPSCLRRLLEDLNPGGYSSSVWQGLQSDINCANAGTPAVDPLDYHHRMELDRGRYPHIANDMLPVHIDPAALCLGFCPPNTTMLYPPPPQPDITCGNAPGGIYAPLPGPCPVVYDYLLGPPMSPDPADGDAGAVRDGPAAPSGGTESWSPESLFGGASGGKERHGELAEDGRDVKDEEEEEEEDEEYGERESSAMIED